MAEKSELSAKARLRQLSLRARAALSEAERTAKSAAIAERLRNWQPYRTARTLCLYASFGSEVQTTRLLADNCAQSSATAVAGDGCTQGSIAEPAGDNRGQNSAIRVAGGGERIVCLPRVEGASLVLHHLPCPLAEAALVRSPMGMPEPLATLPQVRPQDLDLILVPGSAFSLRDGHRLGYGKGYYDRLLAAAPQALKVGLCFDVQLFTEKSFPSDPHDIALDVLVSESGIRDLRET